jgi:hypothetical protein
LIARRTCCGWTSPGGCGAGRRRARIADVAKTTQSQVEHRRETEAMTRTPGLTWEDEVVQADLRARKEVSRALLEKRFGTLSDAVLQRIEAASDGERLKAGVLQVLEIDTPEKLDL